MAHPENEPLYLIVTDRDRGIFTVEGPMTDTTPWEEAATFARSHHRHIVVGPTGTRRDDLAAEYQGSHRMLAGVPPGSILRPRQYS
ncbi:MAG: hypothetical protein FWD12_08390 [Alphaproteobacteria bacterium]|nr:hypothetical protein [Alphaproteobacteria bacterium]